MITKLFESVFRPKAEMENSQIRKSGAIFALLGFVVIAVVYTIILSNILGGQNSQFLKFVPMVLLFIAILFGLGLHRLIWGNTCDDPLFVSWGKGFGSIIAAIGTIMITSFIGGLIVGLLKQMSQ